MWKKKKIHKMALCRGLSLLAIHIALLASLCSAADLFVYFDFEVSYITASPLGVPQQVPFSRSLSFSSHFLFHADMCNNFRKWQTG